MLNSFNSNTLHSIMNRHRYILIFIITVYSTSFTFAQNQEEVNYAINNDTLHGYVLRDINIEGNGDEYRRKYNSAKYYIRRMYPYAMLASQMLREYQDTLNTITSERKKNKFLRQANKELKEEFGDEIRDLSVTRGKYLIKLIYRETGISVYDIIKQYRGGVKAIFWQSLCVVNGQDLKETFDPEEDIIIERIVQEIESGKIKIIPREPKTEKGKEADDRHKRRKNKTKSKMINENPHVAVHS